MRDRQVGRSGGADFARELAIRRFEKTSAIKVKLSPRPARLRGTLRIQRQGARGSHGSTGHRQVRRHASRPSLEDHPGVKSCDSPSAVAASVLGDELGVRATTLHSLVLADLMGEKGDIDAGDMLLVNEAGMAGTLDLDHILALATERGAVVRPVGDYRQLTAVEAGGALSLIFHGAGGVDPQVHEPSPDPHQEPEHDLGP